MHECTGRLSTKTRCAFNTHSSSRAEIHVDEKTDQTNALYYNWMQQYSKVHSLWRIVNMMYGGTWVTWLFKVGVLA